MKSFRQLLTVPKAERLALGRQFLSSENQALLREQATRSAAKSQQTESPQDFVYDFVEPGSGDNFEFGINDNARGFYKFAACHGDERGTHHGIIAIVRPGFLFIVQSS